MKIANYEVAQQASTAYSRLETSVTKLETYVVKGNSNGNNLSNIQNNNAHSNTNSMDQFSQPSVRLSISDDALKLNETETGDMFSISDIDKAKLRLLENFITAITGKKFKFQQLVKLEDVNGKSSSGSQSAKPGKGLIQISLGNSGTSAQFGGRITTSHYLSEKETMQFKSGGVIKTEDGQTLNFSVNLTMSRSFEMTSTQMIEFGAKLQDPLVINFDGKGVQFGGDSLHLDINLDKNIDIFKNLADGSGFLAIDKNNNGKVDDGSELFGARTGSGFVELSAYDKDSNGWIDENDAIFESLKVWSVGADGTMKLLGLKESGVGAIYLSGVNSPYQMKNGDEVLGKIKKSSVYLKENGGAGTIHEIDLKL